MEASSPARSCLISSSSSQCSWLNATRPPISIRSKIFCVASLGANSAWGLGAPSDGGTLALADRALLDSVALFCLKWCDRAILDLDLNEQTCPFCYNAATNPISSQWAVFAFWENTSLTEQTRLLELCSSTASNVTSLAVCGDRNWTSETTG